MIRLDATITGVLTFKIFRFIYSTYSFAVGLSIFLIFFFASWVDGAVK